MERRRMKRLNDLAAIGIVYIGISVLWVIGEKVVYGQTYPRLQDDFIAIGLSVLFVGAYRVITHKGVDEE